MSQRQKATASNQHTPSAGRFAIGQRGAGFSRRSRIEALFFVYFLALLVQALIERELRRAMQRSGVETLALYSEERNTHRPTAEQVLRLFSLVQRHVLEHDGQHIRSFEPELTDLQLQVLDLLGVAKDAYRTPR